MAIIIKSIPVLSGKVAVNFAKKVASNICKKSTVDFSKEYAISSKILAKAKF